MTKINYRYNTASHREIYEHLLKTEPVFLNDLRSRVNLKDYSKKMSKNSKTFEMWDDNFLVGIICAYFKKNKSYISNVSVLQEYYGQGLAKDMLRKIIKFSENRRVSFIELEVNIDNIPAIKLYKKFGFVYNDGLELQFIKMSLNLKDE